MAGRMYGLNEAVFHPDVEVRAGPWRARMRELTYAGWRFEMEVSDFGRDTRILARSPHSGMVSMFRGPTDVFRYQVSRDAVYFPEEVALSNEVGVFKEMRIPTLAESDLLSVNVGMPIRMDMGMEPEFHFITPYTNDDPPEIVVTLDKVPMLLEEIRKAQEPAARELLHKQRKRDDLQKFKQEAKILSFK